MALWLMHTYALGLCGKLPQNFEELSLEERALLLGNIAPDWVNFVPGGRQKYRKQSHYKNDDHSIRFEDFKEEHLYPAEDSIEYAFYVGYGLHLLLDSHWHQNIYQAYLPFYKEKGDYYKECVRWDAIIDSDWPRGHECRVLLGESPALFDGVLVDPTVIPTVGLDNLKEQAKIFSTEPLPAEKPCLFKEKDVLRTLEAFREDALQFLGSIK